MIAARLPILAACLALTFALSAQTPDTLSRYADFFHRQIQPYQSWLDQSGLGQVLYARETEVRGDSLLILYLGFHAANTDTVLAQWDLLKRGFDALHSGATLEQELFHKMTYYMEIAPEKAQVRLFDTYEQVNGAYKTACFKARIQFAADSVKTSVGRCMDETRIIAVQAPQLQGARSRTAVASFKTKNSKQAVFARLLPYLQARYTRQQCDDRYPNFQHLDNGEDLHFIVNDLCREVLTDAENPWWCQALYGLGCGSCKNCIKRERLDVHIAYLETRQGYQLKLDVNAAYGSGWYDKPRDNGYHDIQLERPADLKKYADRLSSELYTFLSKPKP